MEDVRIEIKKENREGALIYRAEAFKEPSLPLFGRQTFLAAQESLCYRLEGFEASRFMAVYQHKDWWVRPAFGCRLFEVPERTQLLLLEEGQTYTAILAVCGDKCRSDIRGCQDGLEITLSLNQEGCNAVRDVSLVTVTGDNPYVLCETAVRTALAATGRKARHRSDKGYPELFEYFGWCSWDAFYHKVNAEGIRAKMEELKEKEIPVKWVLIDDGWLDADYERQVLRGLDADKSKFPQGLGSFTEELKEHYQIAAVGVWHAIMGYWNGLEPGSRAAFELAEGSMSLPDGRIIPDAEPGGAFRFYHKWHSYLKNQCGIDFIKVDGQSAVSLFYKGSKTYGEASWAIQNGLGASAALNFHNNIINCMGMASEDMWNRPGSAISRSSDDFVPDVAHGFREHAIQNSYNSLLQGELFYGDWDMFWSAHEENRQNSMLRAVSGGPVYISDAVGQTDPAYIMPLLLEDGRVTRCEGIGVPTQDSLFVNPVDMVTPLKIFNRYGASYIITALNINAKDEPCSGEIHIGDIPGLQGKDWYVYDYRGRSVSVLTQQSPVSFLLEANDANLFVLVKKEGIISPLGLVDKYISTAGISQCHIEPEKAFIQLKQGGTFGFAAHRPCAGVFCGGREVKAECKGNGLYLIPVADQEKPLVEIRY